MGSKEILFVNLLGSYASARNQTPRHVQKHVLQNVSRVSGSFRAVTRNRYSRVIASTDATETITASVIETTENTVSPSQKYSVKDAMAGIEAVLLDQDGVLWHGEEAIEGSVDAVRTFQRKNIKTLFVTNNATQSRRSYAQKLNNFGIDASPEDVITSGSALAQHLVSLTSPIIQSVYLIGEKGLQEELELHGLECITHDSNMMDAAAFSGICQYKAVDAVAIGWDRGFNFSKLCHASVYLQKGAYFAATNRDPADMTPSGFLYPGTGPILKSVEHSINRKAKVLGKPNPDLIYQILDLHNLSASSTIMVGDRLDTDILFANNGGIRSALVLTGCTQQKDLELLSRTDPRTPDYVFPSLASLASVY